MDVAMKLYEQFTGSYSKKSQDPPILQRNTILNPISFKIGASTPVRNTQTSYGIKPSPF
jgi:hypothetical protein